MSHTFTRKALYDLVWSEPLHTLAVKYGLTGRGFAKACEKAHVPVPERGYWNKLKAGKPVSKSPLPIRGIGMSNEITIGGNSWGGWQTSDQDILKEEIPPEPVFETEIETIRLKATALVDKAPLPKTLAKPHTIIAKILAETIATGQLNRRSADFPAIPDEPSTGNLSANYCIRRPFGAGCCRQKQLFSVYRPNYPANRPELGFLSNSWM